MTYRPGLLDRYALWVDTLRNPWRAIMTALPFVYIVGGAVCFYLAVIR